MPVTYPHPLLHPSPSPPPPSFSAPSMNPFPYPLHPPPSPFPLLHPCHCFYHHNGASSYPSCFRRGVENEEYEEYEDDEEGRWPEHLEMYNESYLSHLMMRRWGRYEVLRLFIRYNEESDLLLSLLRILSSNSDMLLSLSLHPYGAMSLREFLRNIKEDENICLMLSALAKIAPAVAMSRHGWGVIKYCVTRFSFKQNQRLLKKIAKNCFNVAMDKYGSRVLQHCVALAEGEVEEYMVQQFVNHGIALAENCYGNLIIQYLLVRDEKTPAFVDQIVKRFCGKFVALSMVKYGCCVVEQFLRQGGERTVDVIADELIEGGLELICNPCGKHVVITAAKLSKGELRDKLLKLIDSYMHLVN